MSEVPAGRSGLQTPEGPGARGERSPCPRGQHSAGDRQASAPALGSGSSVADDLQILLNPLGHTWLVGISFPAEASGPKRPRVLEHELRPLLVPLGQLRSKALTDVPRAVLTGNGDTFCPWTRAGPRALTTRLPRWPVMFTSPCPPQTGVLRPPGWAQGQAWGTSSGHCGGRGRASVVRHVPQRVAGALPRLDLGFWEKPPARLLTAPWGAGWVFRRAGRGVTRLDTPVTPASRLPVPRRLETSEAKMEGAVRPGGGAQAGGGRAESAGGGPPAQAGPGGRRSVLAENSEGAAQKELGGHGGGCPLTGSSWTGRGPRGPCGWAGWGRVTQAPVWGSARGPVVPDALLAWPTCTGGRWGGGGAVQAASRAPECPVPLAARPGHPHPLPLPGMCPAER